MLWVILVTVCNSLHCLLGGLLFLAFDFTTHYGMAIVYSGVLLILSSIMVHILASVRYIYLVPCLCIHLPVAAKAFLTDVPGFSLIGIGYVIGAIQFIDLNKNTYYTILQSIQLRFKNDDLIRELEQKNHDAEQANLLKTKFLAAASHDLRQPLHTMSLFLQILQNKIHDSEQSEYVNKIVMSNESLTKMLNTLLDISKMDANTLEIHPEHFDLVEVFKLLMDEFKPLAQQKRLQLHLKTQPKTIAYTDKFFVERILRNLLDNAIKYTHSGHIILGCEETHSGYKLIVTDTGLGIPPSDQAQIFEEFYQLHNPQRDRRLGLGLGLSIVQRLCRLLKTEIQVVSQENTGSEFSFHVPKGDPLLIKSESLITPSGLIPELRVLLIDDEAEILTGMTQLLQSWGCIVKTAQSADQGLKIVMEEKFVPTVIISDYRLRENKNGFEAITAIRARLGNFTLPAVILTGDTTPEVLNLCKGHDLLLLYKPVKPAKLLSTLKSLS